MSTSAATADDANWGEESCCFGIDRFFASADEGTFEMSPAVSYGPFVGKRSDGKAFNFPVINQQQTQMDEICKVILANQKLPNHITGEEGIKDVKIINAISVLSDFEYNSTTGVYEPKDGVTNGLTDVQDSGYLPVNASTGWAAPCGRVE